MRIADKRSHITEALAELRFAGRVFRFRVSGVRKKDVDTEAVPHS
jgi:hypothetical protein